MSDGPEVTINPLGLVVVFDVASARAIVGRRRNPPTDGSVLSVVTGDYLGSVDVDTSTGPQTIDYVPADLPEPFSVEITKDSDDGYAVNITVNGQPFYTLTQLGQPVIMSSNRNRARCNPWPPNAI